MKSLISGQRKFPPLSANLAVLLRPGKTAPLNMGEYYLGNQIPELFIPVKANMCEVASFKSKNNT